MKAPNDIFTAAFLLGMMVNSLLLLLFVCSESLACLFYNERFNNIYTVVSDRTKHGTITFVGRLFVSMWWWGL
jgi:hypothetical protein